MAADRQFMDFLASQVWGGTSDGRVHAATGDVVCVVAPGPVRARLARAIAALPEIIDALDALATQHYCGCGHPACNDCKRDCRAAEALERAGLPAPGRVRNTAPRNPG